MHTFYNIGRDNFFPPLWWFSSQDTYSRFHSKELWYAFMPSLLGLLWLSCMMIYSSCAIRNHNHNEEDVGLLCTGVIIRPCTFGAEFVLWPIYACLQPLVSLDTLFLQRYNIWLCRWAFQVLIEEPAVNKDLCQGLKGCVAWCLWLEDFKWWLFKITVFYVHVANRWHSFL